MEVQQKIMKRLSAKDNFLLFLFIRKKPGIIFLPGFLFSFFQDFEKDITSSVYFFCER